MNDITININGGNNQILPNATEAVQNFYGDQFAEKILSNTVVDKELCPEVGKLSLYVAKGRRILMKRSFTISSSVSFK